MAALDCPHCGMAPADADGFACDYCRGYAHRPTRTTTPTFRTATGQTGRDAYVFEAAAIANAVRELDGRFVRLLEAAHNESPELFECTSDYDSQLTLGAQSARGFVEYLRS